MMRTVFFVVTLSLATAESFVGGSEALKLKFQSVQQRADAENKEPVPPESPLLTVGSASMQVLRKLGNGADGTVEYTHSYVLTLVNMLHNEKNVNIRIAALQTLRFAPSDTLGSHVPALLKMFEDDNWRVREAAFLTLRVRSDTLVDDDSWRDALGSAISHNGDVLTTLVNMLKVKNFCIRVAVLQTLRMAPSDMLGSHVPALIAMLDHEDLVVRIAALRVLQQVVPSEMLGLDGNWIRSLEVKDMRTKKRI